MKLRDLNATFIGCYHAPDAEDATTFYKELPSIEGAQGVSFQCPKCAVGLERGEEDGRRFVRGAHHVLCWFRNPRNVEPVPATAEPGPGRWWVEEQCTGLDDLTFGHGVPHIAKSVQLTGGCNWHGYIEAGEATLA